MKQLDGGYKICPVCHTKNEASAFYCSNCFYDLSTVSVTEDEQKSLKLVGDKFAILIIKDTTIGREATGKEYLNDLAVSRKHLKIFWKNGVPNVQDLNSSNGSYLNNQKMLAMQEYAISNNNKISIANKFEFIIKTQSSQDDTIQEVILEDQTYTGNEYENDDKTIIHTGSVIDQFVLEQHQKINGYKIKTHLASGGESDTYLVTKDDTEYVLKFYRTHLMPDLKLVENIKKITQEHSENLVVLEEFWKEDNKYFEVYEFCKYGNLASFLKSDKNVFNFTEKETLFDLVTKINKGLKDLHKSGILHRDLKPSNILLRDDLSIVLSDFGIAKDIESCTVYTKNFKGSYKYSAPETLSNQFNKKSDYWSLGVIAYELYFKQNPFEKMSVNAVFSELLNDKPFPIPSEEVDSQVLVLLQGLLYKDSLKRWGSEEVDNFLKNVQRTTNNNADVLKGDYEKDRGAYDVASLEQKEWGEKGFSSEAAYRWRQAGFSLADASFLRSLDIDLEEAEYAKKEGLTIREMKILKTRVRCLIQNTSAHYGSVNAVAYSSQDSLLASGGNDYAVKLWDEIASESYATLEHHTDRIESIAFSPDGKIVASASRDKSINLWNPHKKEYIGTLEGHENYVGCIAFSPDGSLLASGGLDTKVNIWDVEKREVIDSYNENLSYVCSIAFSNNGKYLSSGSEDGTVYIWDIQKKELVSRIESDYPCTSFVSFHPSKEELLAYTGINGQIFVWDVEKKRLVANLENKIEKTSLSFSNSGDLLACGGADGSIILWDMNFGNAHTVLRKNLEELYMSDGSVSAIKNGDEIEIWDQVQNRRISTIKLTSSAINSVAFTGNNRFLACGVNDGFMQIWESYLPTTIETILQNGLSVREYFVWLEKGYDVYEAKNWKEKGFEVVAANSWKDSSFLAKEAKEWSLNSFALVEAIEWKSLGFSPYDAGNWAQEGLTTAELNDWMDADFSLVEAREWILEDFDMEEAKKWRDDGISPKKAKKWRKFGIIGRFIAKFF